MVRRLNCPRVILRKADVWVLAEIGDGQDMEDRNDGFVDEVVNRREGLCRN